MRWIWISLVLAPLTLMAQEVTLHKQKALTYQANTHRFWTTSEFTLKADGLQPSIERKIKNRLRLQSFGDDLQSNSNESESHTQKLCQL